MYGKIFSKTNNAQPCLKEGAAALNASMANGNFGTCCKGLRPATKDSDIGKSGAAAYCTKIK